jgi:hypothetical protein
LGDVVEAAVRVLFQPPDRGQIILETVVVAVAEQPHAKLLIVEEEAAEIELERLDPGADTVEIVAGGDVAEVIVDERFLHPHEAVEARGALGRLDEQYPALRHVDIIGVEGERQTIFDIRRLEYR